MLRIRATSCRPFWFRATLLVAGLLTCVSNGFAQFYVRQVGGVWVDAAGVLRNTEIDETNKLRDAREKALAPQEGELEKPCTLRKISLRRLEATIATQLETGKPLADEVVFLAGLQHIQYIFLYPDEHDIVLAGPGEGWKVSPQGEIVGADNGRPVLLLDDLIVALRGVEACRESGISCSIDPTSEGLVRLKALVDQLKKNGGGDAIASSAAAIEETLGPQTITIGGVPPESHFARVLVAADYRMKRLAMGFEAAPIKGLPSFLQMSKGGPRGMGSMMQRWWLEPDYDSVAADENGEAWEIRGARVRAATEEDLLSEAGDRARTGKANPVAKKWADNMTRHYDELGLKEPIFGQLRNCIDLAVAAALIAKEGLIVRADCRLPNLTGRGDVASVEFDVPRQVSTQVSLLKKGSNWLISASGGVKLNPWAILEDTKSTDALAPRQAAAKPPADNWWWN